MRSANPSSLKFNNKNKKEGGVAFFKLSLVSVSETFLHQISLLFSASLRLFEDSLENGL